MPFVVQCPHDPCRKYMLLEDSMRGAKVECLVCRRMIAVDPSGSGSKSGERPTPPVRSTSSTPPPTPAPSTPPPPPVAKPPSAQRQSIGTCPNCDTLLRLPPDHKGQAIRCPRCSHVFTP